MECGAENNEREIWYDYCRIRGDPDDDGSVCLQCGSCPCEWIT